MTLLETIKADTLELRKKKKAATAALLTTLIAEIEIVGKNDGSRVTTDAEATTVIHKFVKNANEVLAVAKGDNAVKAALEIEILSRYLPKQLTDAELREVIASVIAKGAGNMGQIMTNLKANYDGQYNGKVASTLAKEMLS